MKIWEAFEKFTVAKNLAGGRIGIKCKLGLWSVSAATQETAMVEARRYFAQYWADGEYDHLIPK